MKHPLETLDGFKYYRFGKLGEAYQIGQAITADYAFNHGLDLSADGRAWFPAFTETSDEG